MSKHSTDTLEAAVKGYNEQIKNLEKNRDAVAAELGKRGHKEFHKMLGRGKKTGTKAEQPKNRKHKMSNAARKKIAAAQKKRWAEFYRLKAEGEQYQKD